MLMKITVRAVIVLAAVAPILCGCSDRSGSPDVSEARDAGPATENRLTVDGTSQDLGAVMEQASSEASKLMKDVLPGAIVAMDALTKSDHFRSLQPLLEFVEGRTVVGSEGGNAGFLLRLDSDRWAAAYRDGDRVAHAKGTGEPPDSVRSAVRSAKYGDASDPIPGEIANANRHCDIPAELRNAHGQTLEGLVFRTDSFNFSFRGGRQLDVRLVDDAKGKPALRVFWK